MAITLYFPFSSITNFIPYALYGAYLIIFSIFLILTNKQYSDDHQNSSLLKIAAIINFISVVALLFVPVGFSTSGSIPDDQRILFYIMFYTLPSLVAFVPRILSFGIIFLVYGYRNKERSGNYLLLSGIFWLIFTTWSALSLIVPYYNIPQLPSLMLIIFPSIEIYSYLIFYQILGLGSIFGALGGIYLLIHSFINEDRNLKIAGFVYLVGTAIVSLGIIPQYIQLL